MSNNELAIKSILMAEDEEHIARLVSFKLTKEGFKLIIAKNGQEAIDLLPSQEWSLIILDIMMPIKTGWEVLKEIRSSPNKTIAKTPVLVLSAKGLKKEVANAAELDAEQYLKKPFDPNELAALVKKLVR